jgi:hypothetical protein
MCKSCETIPLKPFRIWHRIREDIRIWISRCCRQRCLWRRSTRLSCVIDTTVMGTSVSLPPLFIQLCRSEFSNPHSKSRLKVVTQCDLFDGKNQRSKISCQGPLKQGYNMQSSYWYTYTMRVTEAWTEHKKWEQTGFLYQQRNVVKPVQKNFLASQHCKKGLMLKIKLTFNQCCGAAKFVWDSGFGSGYKFWCGSSDSDTGMHYSALVYVLNNQLSEKVRNWYSLWHFSKSSYVEYKVQSRSWGGGGRFRSQNLIAYRLRLQPYVVLRHHNAAFDTFLSNILCIVSQLKTKLF